MSPPSLGKLGFQETAGRRWRPASWTISLWCTSVMKVSVGRISPPFGAPAKLSKAGSMSALERTGTAVACTPSVGAAASIDRMKNLDCGDVSGLNMTPIQVGRGGGQNDVWHQSDQLRRVDACELGIAGVPANIDADVLAFGPS